MTEEQSALDLMWEMILKQKKPKKISQKYTFLVQLMC